MPNRDGTGPLGKGAGTGRLRGGCAAGQVNYGNNPGQGMGRRNGGAKGPGSSGNSGRKGLNRMRDK